MKREQAENAMMRLRKVCRDLTEGSALLKQATPPSPAVTAELLDQAVTELGDVKRVLQDEVTARAKHANEPAEEILAQVRALLVGYEFDDECADAYKVADVAELVDLTVARDGHNFLRSIQEGEK